MGGTARRRASAAALAAAYAGLSGCFIIPAPKPFAYQVAARQLDLVSTRPQLPASALTVTAPPQADNVVVAGAQIDPTPASSAVEPPAAPPPERTNVKGEGDGSMELDRVIIRDTTIQQRAPNYSSEQAAAMTCGSLKDNFFVDNALRMHAATVKAEKARVDFDAGRITGKQLDKAEVERQDAVIGYLLPVPVLNWFLGPTEKKGDLPAPVHGPVRIENPDLFTFTENGRDVIAVSGVVRNTSDTRLNLPPVTLRALDEWDYSIAGQTSLLPFESLGPREARKFEVRFLNPPANTAEVYIHFAPPFLYRTRRDCEFFDPSTFDSTAKLNTKQAPAAPPPADRYSAGELNVLTQFYRRESQAAWSCQENAKCDGAQATQRLNWREMFVMAESIDEAWVALAAAEAIRAKSPDSEATREAQAASNAAMKRFRDLGAKALVRSGASVRDVTVAVTQSTYGRDEAGLFVDIGGTLTNEGSVARKVEALMIAFVDRLELPLSSVAVPVEIELAPGETKPFGQRLSAGAPRGTDGVQMAFGEKREAPPARIPPRDIPWQVRIGAMAKVE